MFPFLWKNPPNILWWPKIQCLSSSCKEVHIAPFFSLESIKPCCLSSNTAVLSGLLSCLIASFEMRESSGQVPPCVTSTCSHSFQHQQKGISPRMLKALVSKGHPEFSSNRQQDAHEFFLHIINLVQVSEVNQFTLISAKIIAHTHKDFNIIRINSYT